MNGHAVFSTPFMIYKVVWVRKGIWITPVADSISPLDMTSKVDTYFWASERP